MTFKEEKDQAEQFLAKKQYHERSIYIHSEVVSLIAEFKRTVSDSSNKRSKEEILQKHFTAEFKHDGRGKFMQYILDAMEEYANQFHTQPSQNKN